ncbi:MAG: TonB-dependent receptor [Sedimentisphaerales bacterium]|nr:TonB-dependent receptor [Sedimentisphaerales bacterium]
MGTRRFHAITDFAKYFTTAILVALSLQTSAALAEPAPKTDLFEMSIEELMEVPIATATSRLPQAAGEPSMPVSVITAEDIRSSGLTSIPEILRLAPGVDVLQIDRRKYAVGIRGLHETLSDRVTLLLNGRPCDNPVYGGPDFAGLPVMIEDIERIEIVRGPGSAAWGANATTGVINIVTKKPEDILGGLAKTTITEFGDTYTHLRYAQKQGKWAWKVSAGYEGIKDSDDAVHGNATYNSTMPALNALMGFSAFRPRDFSRNQRFDIEAIKYLSDMTKLSFGIGHSHIEMGDYEMGGYLPMKDMREDHIRSFMRIDAKFDNGASGYLQWNGRFWNANWPQTAIFATRQHELEAQYNFHPAHGHQTSIGASFKWDHFNTTRDTVQQALMSGDPLDEYNAGIFGIHRFKATDRLTLEAQIRADWYSGTHTDISGRATALYSLDNAEKHILRFSAAKAFRAPLASIRKFSTTMLPAAPSLFMINVNAPHNVENEETYSLEAGYTGKLTKQWTLKANAYYQRCEKLIGYRKTTNFLGQTFARADNIDGADSWGIELEMEKRFKAGKIAAWYTYNAFEPDQTNQDFGAFLPAKHKAGLTARFNLPEKWRFNTNYTFVNTTPPNPMTANNTVKASNRLDLTISKEFNRGKNEITFGVRDLLKKTHDSITESIEYAGHEIPGRTFFCSLLCRF